jgi:hypothetical protein
VKRSSHPLANSISDDDEHSKRLVDNILDEAAFVLIGDELERIIRPCLLDLLHVFFESHLEGK